MPTFPRHRHKIFIVGVAVFPNIFFGYFPLMCWTHQRKMSKEDVTGCANDFQTFQIFLSAESQDMLCQNNPTASSFPLESGEFEEMYYHLHKLFSFLGFS